MAEGRNPARFPSGTFNLVLGKTFEDDREGEKSEYHTLTYDFIPKSVDAEAESYIAFGNNGEVQVAVPGGGNNLTVFKGMQLPTKSDKECLLFFDATTGEARLEKVSKKYSVKKIRDTDEASTAPIRAGILKLQKERSKGTNATKEDVMTSSESSSSSSESGDSDSDSSSGSERRAPTAGRHESSSEDDDKRSINDGIKESFGGPPKLPPPRNAPSMPSVGNTNSSSSYHAPSKPSSFASTSIGAQGHMSQNTKKLLDDLQLSESSDED